MSSLGVRSTLVALGLILAGPAAAQSSDPVAEALFRAGRDAARAGDHETACEKFRESQRLDPALGTVLNIAICEEALGRLADAWQHYEEVIHGLEPDDERFAVAWKRSRALESRVPRLTVRLADDAPAATHLVLGDVELTDASVGVPLPLNPGDHELVASAEGYAPRSYDLRLDEGEKKELVVSPGPEVEPTPKTAATPAPTPEPETPHAKPKPAPAVPPNEPTTERHAGPRRAIGLTLVGVGAASVVTSGVLGLLVIDRDDTVDAQCDDTKECSRKGLRATHQGRRLSRASTALFAVGLTGVGAGLYLTLSGSPDASARAGSATVVRTTIHPRGASAELVHRF